MTGRSLVGRPLAAVSTPALVVEEADLAFNLSTMAGFFAGRAARLRPHFKSHKCVTLARRQLAAGNTVGITCAKLSEAEVLVAGGVADVLIANQIVGPEKTRRVAELNRQALVRVAVDSEANVAELAAAAREAGVEVGLLVEVDIGMGRCGVPPGAAAVALAARVAASSGLRCDGLQGYEGHLQFVADPEERRTRVQHAMGVLVETRRALEAAGIPVAIVSGGGTGTYDLTGDLPGVDEVQAGSYALMDAHYRARRPEFRAARTVLATIISCAPGRAIADVGTKGLGGEFGPPVLLDHPEAQVVKVAEEHTILHGLEARVGDRVRLLPSHGCTTNNLYPDLWIARDGIIVDHWPVEGAGCVG